MKSSLVNMVLVLTGISVVTGGLLAAVHHITAEPIRQAEALAKAEALAEVLPVFADNKVAATCEIVPEGETRAVTVYRAVVNGTDAGMAVESYTTEGFSGEIAVMVGFDAEGTLTGYKVLQHAETPGLGAKADTWFRDSVGHRSIIGTKEKLHLSNENPEGIDGITAATITSRAFLDAVNRARKAFNKAKEQ